MKLLNTFASAFLCSLLIGTPVFAQIVPGPGPSFYYTGTAVQVANTTTATDILSISVPAGYVTAGVHCRLVGDISTKASGQGTFTLTSTYGAASATTLANAVTPTASMSTSPFIIDIYLQQTSDTGHQNLTGTMRGALGASGALAGYTGAAALTQTSTGSLALKVTVTWGTADSANVLNMNAANCAVGA